MSPPGAAPWHPERVCFTAAAFSASAGVTAPDKVDRLEARTAFRAPEPDAQPVAVAEPDAQQAAVAAAEPDAQQAVAAASGVQPAVALASDAQQQAAEAVVSDA